MTTTATIVFSLLAAGAGADSRSGSASPADLAKARDLVTQLADAKFKVRDAAERELIRMGLPALPALKEGEKNSDLHVQERCKQLQPMIRSLTLQKRVDSFLANRGAELPKDLPFLASFIKITGDSKEARELYADILQANADLLDEAERDRKKGVQLFIGYCQEMGRRVMYRPGVDYQEVQKSIKKSDVALYLLLSPELKDSNQRFNNYGYTFLNSPNLGASLGKEANALPMKKIFLNWLEKETLPYMVQRGVQVAAEAKMPEAVPMVLKTVKDAKAPAYTRAEMMLMLAKMGNKEHLEILEPLLGDKTVISTVNFNNNPGGQVQIRDVALAVSIKLSGQKLADYNFDVMKGNEEMFHLSYIYCAFSSEQKREASHKKYKDSIAAQKKK